MAQDEEQPAWRQSLWTYLQGAPVLKEVNRDQLTRHGEEALEKATAALRSKRAAEFETHGDFMGDPDLRLRINEEGLYAVESLSRNAVVACQAGAFPYVAKEFRGRGITAQICFELDNRNQRWAASSYTLEGLMSRVRTHRLHVQAAVDRGEALSEAVADEYRIGADGKAALKTPFDPWAYDAQARAAIDVRLREAFEQENRHLVEPSFLFEDKDEGVALWEHQDGALGAKLSLALHLRYGGEFRVTRWDDNAVFQVEIDGLVLDARGVRRAEDALADLAEQDGIKDPDALAARMSVTRYPSASAFSRAVRDHIRGRAEENPFTSTDEVLEAVHGAMDRVRARAQNAPDEAPVGP